MAAQQVEPADRFDWEKIVRRARLGSVISARKGRNGKVTKGGISGTLFTGIALDFATYADPDGSRVMPGDATVAIDMETSIAAVRAVRQALLDLGLMQKVGNRQKGYGIEYRLTLPSDLFERVDVLTPAQVTLAAGRLRDAARGKTSGLPSGVPESGNPVDNPNGKGPTGSGNPADHPNTDHDESLGWSSGTPSEAFGWSSGTSSGGPVDTHTNQGPDTGTTNHSVEELRTAVTGPRARRRDEDPDSFAEDPEPQTGRCPDHPFMTGGTRPDGLPACPPCRAHVRRQGAVA